MPAFGMPGVVVDAVVIEFLLAHLLRDEQLFRMAANVLEPRHFNGPGERGYQWIWGSALEYYKQQQRLPAYHTLATIVLNRLRNDPVTTPQLLSHVEGYLQWIWGDRFARPEDFDGPAAMELLRLVLMEREVEQSLSDAFQGANRNVTALPDVVTKLKQRIEQIQGLDNRPSPLTVPTDWGGQLGPLIPTGVEMVDNRMGGGSLPGEVHVLLGPTGAGKSLLSLQILESSSALAYDHVLRGAPEGQLCIYVSYEAPLPELQNRLMSCAAGIPTSRLLGPYDQLSTGQSLQPYEAASQADQLRNGLPPRGELERLMEVAPRLNTYTRLLDFTGSREGGAAPRGHGGIPEIRRAIDYVCNEAKMSPRIVLIDWAGMGVRNYLLSQNKDPERAMNGELTYYVNSVREQIAAPFRCCVFVAHQLSGAVTGRSPTAHLTHADALGCKTFAVNAWFAFVLSNKDEATNTCLFSCTKTRRAAPVSREVCYIDGAFGKMTSAGDRYVIDPISRRIVPASEARRVSGARQPPRAGGVSSGVGLGVGLNEE